MRNRYKIFDEDGVYFITSTIVEWLPVFTNKVYFDILIDSMKYCIQEKALNLYAYVIFQLGEVFCTSPAKSCLIDEFSTGAGVPVE